MEPSVENSAVKIPCAVWPDHAPHPEETHVMTVVACESQYRWAIHEGGRGDRDDDFFPIVFWRTSAISTEEVEEAESPTALVNRYFPDHACDVVYGNREADRDKSTAATYRATQRIPALSVYCILPNDTGRRDPDTPTTAEVAERGLAYMLQGSFPCNLYKLQASDFGHLNQYGIHSAEQLATVTAVDVLYPGRHCLIIDGGTTLNLTAVAPPDMSCSAVDAPSKRGNEKNGSASEIDPASNLESHDAVLCLSDETEEPATKLHSVASEPTSNGGSSQSQFGSNMIRIIDDCRTVSISSKLRAMHKQTGALPEITTKQVQESLLELADNDKLTLFATDTKNAMLGCVLYETTLVVRSALKTWALSNIIPEQNPLHDATTYPLVCVTGMESDILLKLLSNSVFELDKDPALTWLHNRADLPEDSVWIQVCRPAGGASEGVVAEVRNHRHLAFHGIRRILSENCKARDNSLTEAEKLRQEILGRRVAKDFDPPFGVYVGQVMSVDRFNKESVDEDFYTVRYDDGDTEEYSVTELYDVLVSYSKMKTSPDPYYRANNEEMDRKKADSQRVARMLADSSVAVQQELERRKKKARSPRVLDSRNNGSSKRAFIESGASNGDEKVMRMNGLNNDKKPKALSHAANVMFDPESFLNRRIAKHFGNRVFFGEIIMYKKPEEHGEVPLWCAEYEDGDREDLEKHDLEQLFAFYARPEICRHDPDFEG